MQKLELKYSLDRCTHHAPCLDRGSSTISFSIKKKNKKVHNHQETGLEKNTLCDFVAIM